MKRSWVEVDLGALAENIRAVRTSVGLEPAIIFVVKANAYGHGIAPIVRRAAESGISWFGVAYVHEAVSVRNAAPNADILVMGVVDSEDVPGLIENRITPIVVSVDHGRALSEAAVAAGGTLRVHVKIDTGMGRLGLPWTEAIPMYKQLLSFPGIDVRGVCTHFATVEPNEAEEAQRQAERLNAFDRARRDFDLRPLMRHISSSRALLHFQTWDLDAIRPGIALYGYGADDAAMRFHTRPILQWKSYVVQVKEVPADFPVGYYATYRTPKPTTLATLCVGYADGFLRTLSNRGIVLIRGRRCRVVGRVSMNWLTVDAGAGSAVAAGDEVVLIGRQGDQEIWAGELARLCRTIPYEILTNIDAGAERRYVG